MSSVSRRIQVRRDTAENWTSINPILADGEIGYETTGFKRMKVGDGRTRWAVLAYFNVGPTGKLGPTGPIGLPGEASNTGATGPTGVPGLSSGVTFQLNYTSAGPIAYSTAVTTLAGSSQGLANDPGTAARFYNPSATAVDSSGIVYVADTENNCIRRITSAGLVTTFAGDGTPGAKDGSGSNAQFNSPSAITITSAGILFVSDAGNHRIRKITSTGIVSTFAGSTSGFQDGIGTNAQFDSPQGIVVDSLGNVFVADANNHRIRIITPSGQVSTFAGQAASGITNDSGASARFNTPTGLAIDSSGNLYVADKNNHRIRKVTPQASVSTLAGSTAGFTDNTGTAAQFSSPVGIAVDSTGTLYVADTGNHRIRTVSSSGVVTTFVGLSSSGNANGTPSQAQFSSPYSITVGTTGVFYVADYGNHRIRKIVVTSSDPNEYGFTPFTGTMITPLNSIPTTSSYIVVPERKTDTHVATFTIPLALMPSTTSIVGQWVLGLNASVALSSSPGSFYFEALDGTSSIVVGASNRVAQTTSGVILATMTVPARTYATNLTLKLFVTTRDLSPMTIRFNGSTLSYLNTTIINVGPTGATGPHLFTIFNKLNHRVITSITDKSDELFANSNLTFNGSNLNVVNTVTTSNFRGQGTVSTPPYAFTGDVTSGMFLPTESNLAFTTAGVERMRITTGNVGIGTTAPGFTLDVNGTANVSGNLSVGSISTSGGGFSVPGNLTGGIIRSSSNGTASIPAYTFSNDLSSGLFIPFTTGLGFATAGRERMTITSSGRVGIGNSDPENTLDVTGTARITSNLSAGATTVTSLAAGSGSITTTGTLSTGGATVTSLAAGSGAITTTGNVSAGSATVTGTLTAGTTTVSSLGAGSGSISTSGNLTGGSTTVTSLAAGSGSITTTGNVSAGSATVTGTLTAGTTTVSSLGAGSGSITTTGNVSAGSATVTGTLTAGTTTVSSLGAGSGAITTSGNLTGGTTTVTSLAAGSGAITTTGNLSAGNASITGVVSSGNGTAGAPSHTFINSTNTGMFSPGSGSVAFSIGGSERMRIAGNGSIGIGRTDPTNTLDVTGTVRFSSNLSAGATTVTSLDAGSGAISTTGTLSGGATTVTGLGAGSGNITTTGNLVSGSGNAGAPTHTFSGNTTVGMFSPAANSVAWTTASTERMRILANGNVGVGTQAPSVLFDVNGAMKTTTLTATSASITDVSLTNINGSKFFSGGASGRTFKLNFAGPPTSTNSVFAGTDGTQGTQSGGVGTGRFLAPVTVTVDLSGNLYVVDNSNKIRTVSPSGVLNDFVTSTALKGICVDNNGNLFLTQSNLIIKVTSGGIVTTFAGQSTAGYGDGSGASIFFNNPQGIAVDSAGNVYVAEYTGNRVRKITSSGVASTLAGSTSGSIGTSGSTDGNGTNARFTAPYYITVDTAGTVYVAEAHRIRKITSDGTVTTFAGQATSGSTNGSGTSATFNTITGLAVDSQGILYVAEGGNYLVRSVSPSGVVSTFSSGVITYPYAIATQRTTSGSVYVIDFNRYVVRRILTSTDATYSTTTLTGTLDTDFATQLNSSTVTVPASTTNAKVMSFSLSTTSPSSILGQWILGLYASVAVPASPASFYFEIVDGSSIVATGTGSTSVNLSTPLQLYTYGLLIPARAYTALTLNLYVTTQASSALTIGFNGLNLSYLSTPIQLYSTPLPAAIAITGTLSAGTVSANNYEYIVASGTLNLIALQVLGFSISYSTVIATIPLFYSTGTQQADRQYVFLGSTSGYNGYLLAPKCRLQLFAYSFDNTEGSNLLDITNNTNLWKWFNNSISNADRYYRLFPV